MTGTIANLGTKVLKKFELCNTYDEKKSNFSCKKVSSFTTLVYRAVYLYVTR